MSDNFEPIAAKREGIDLYIDESRQRVGGEWFIVAGVAVEDSDKFRQLCEDLERTSQFEKVRGKKDESEPLIRLADAVAGATRDLLEYKNNELKEIFSSAIKQEVLVGWRNSIYPEPPGPRPTVYM